MTQECNTASSCNLDMVNLPQRSISKKSEEYFRCASHLPPPIQAYLSLPLPTHAILPHGLRCLPHPHLLVPEEQFVACFIELQPIDPAVMTDCASVVATNKVHLGRKERKQCKYLMCQGNQMPGTYLGQRHWDMDTKKQ